MPTNPDLSPRFSLRLILLPFEFSSLLLEFLSFLFDFKGFIVGGYCGVVLVVVFLRDHGRQGSWGEVEEANVRMLELFYEDLSIIVQIIV